MKASKIRFFAALLSVTILAGACVLLETQEEKPIEEPETPPEEQKDSSNVITQVIEFKPSEWPILSADIFLYTDHLLEHRTINNQDTIHLSLTKNQAYRIVTIANIHGQFNDTALEHYDAWESFETNLSIEDPALPIMTAREDINIENNESISIQLKPALCYVQIRSITQMIGDDVLVENPRAYLSNCSTRTRPLSEGNIAPADQKDTEITYLPYDIGLYTQYPGTILCAYPNETPITPTTPATELVIEYEINGRTKEYRQSIHPIERGCWMLLDIELR